MMSRTAPIRVSWCILRATWPSSESPAQYTTRPITSSLSAGLQKPPVRSACIAKPMIVTAAMVRMKVMIVAGVAKRSLAGSAQTSSVLGSTPSAGMTIAGHDVLGRGHLRESERSACMELLGGDADLRTEAELAPVG